MSKKKVREASEEQRRAAKIVALCFDVAHHQLQTVRNLTGVQLDAVLEDFIIKMGAIPTSKGAYGFPNAVCISVGSCVAHGVPYNSPFWAGDLVKVDITAGIEDKDGNIHHADAARTFVYLQEDSDSTVTQLEIALIAATNQALAAAKTVIKPGVKVRKITEAMNKSLDKTKFLMADGLCGHGIGLKMHMRPYIANAIQPPVNPDTVSAAIADQEYRLKIGDVICVEPIVTIRGPREKEGQDARLFEEPLEGTDIIEYHTASGEAGAHAEDTIEVVKGGNRTLTTLSDGASAMSAAIRLFEERNSQS